MSWVERSETFSRTSSRTSENSSSPPADDNNLNLTLYGCQMPLRRTRTIIHRAKSRTLRTLSLVPGLGAGNVAKLFAEDTTFDLGFTLQNDTPYKPIGETSSSVQTEDRCESDSSVEAGSEHSDECTSKSASSIDSSPLEPPKEPISRSSTCASWTTDEYSVKSERGSVSKHLDDSGEWNTFWKKYNAPNINDPNFLPIVPLANTGSDISSNNYDKRRAPDKKSPQMQKVIMSTADAIEAASCARRLSEILSRAIRRSSLPCTNKDQGNLLPNAEGTIPEPPPLPQSDGDCKLVVRSKSESELPRVNITSKELQSKKLSLKPLSEDRVEIEIEAIDPLNIANLLQKVLIERREVIGPGDDSTSGCQTQRSDWSSLE